jgi:hypothetical protein
MPPDCIRHNGGRALLDNIFAGSIVRAMYAAYPTHVWLPWKFRQQKLGNGFWSKKTNQREFLDWLGSELGYKKMDDWMNLTVDDLQSNYGGSLLFRYGSSPLKLIKSVYFDDL